MPGKKSCARARSTVWLIWLIIFISPLSAIADTVAVIYPRLPEPERDVFSLMRAGVHDAVHADKSEVVEIEITDNETPARLAERIKTSGATRVCVLGRKAYELS